MNHAYVKGVVHSRDLNACSKFQSSITISFCPPGNVFTLPVKTIFVRSIAEISSRLKLRKVNYFKPIFRLNPTKSECFFRKLDHFSSWIRRKFGILCTFRAGIRLNLCKLSLKMYVFSSVKAILRLFYVKKGINVFKRSLKLFTAVHGRYMGNHYVISSQDFNEDTLKINF